MPGGGPQTDTIAITQGHLSYNAESPPQRRSPNRCLSRTRWLSTGAARRSPGMPGPGWAWRSAGGAGGRRAAVLCWALGVPGSGGWAGAPGRGHARGAGVLAACRGGLVPGGGMRMGLWGGGVDPGAADRPVLAGWVAEVGGVERWRRLPVVAIRPGLRQQAWPGRTGWGCEGKGRGGASSTRAAGRVRRAAASRTGSCGLDAG